jgi:hypothetical protein
MVKKTDLVDRVSFPVAKVLNSMIKTPSL